MKKEPEKQEEIVEKENAEHAPSSFYAAYGFPASVTLNDPDVFLPLLLC
ncbi:MAG: hypothetical protein R3A45_05790 [Bdellovibrionota bacterium]